MGGGSGSFTIVYTTIEFNLLDDELFFLSYESYLLHFLFLIERCVFGDILFR